MAKGKGEIKGWITKNGVHIPIYGDYTVRGGVEPKAKGSKFKGGKRKKVDTSTTSGKTANDLNSNLKKKGLELDSADLSSMTHKDFNDEKVTMYDKDGNTYEGTYNKYKNGDREIVDIKKTGGRDTGKSEVSKGHTEEGKGAVKDVEGKKPVTQTDENRPKNFKEGLKQHEGIQQIAEEQNRKVWNGGASNQELYDAADKFAEEKNFNKDKVRDAAFSAFNEKWVNEKNSRQEKFAEENRQKAMQEFQESRKVGQESSKVDRKQDAIDYIAKREDVHPSVAKDTYGHMSESERNHVANEAYKRKQGRKYGDIQNDMYDAAISTTNKKRATPEEHEQATNYLKNNLKKTPKLVAPTPEMLKQLGIDPKTYGTHNLDAAKEAQERYKKSANYADQKNMVYQQNAKKAKERDQALANEILAKALGGSDAVSRIAAGEHTVDIQTDGSKKAIAKAKRDINKTAAANDVRYGISENKRKGVVTGSRLNEGGGTFDTAIRNMSVSGLKQAYNTATGSEKSAIRQRLRSLGYTFVGGKWVKGK